MKLRFIKRICVLALLFVLTGDLMESVSFVTQVKAQGKQVKTRRNQKKTTEKDKLEIVKLLIFTTKVNSKDICFEKQTLYFSKNALSKYVLNNFPGKVGDCETVLIDEMLVGKPAFYYHRFRSWSLRGRLVHVNFATHFRDGNTGDCDYILEKRNSRWKIKSEQCNATAS